MLTSTSLEQGTKEFSDSEDSSSWVDVVFTCMTVGPQYKDKMLPFCFRIPNEHEEANLFFLDKTNHTLYFGKSSSQKDWNPNNQQHLNAMKDIIPELSKGTNYRTSRVI